MAEDVQRTLDGLVSVRVSGHHADLGDPSSEKAARFLTLARQRFQTVEVAERELRERMRDDLKFRASEQWPQDIAAQRKIDRQPIITINRLPTFIRQVTNQQRSSKPSIMVTPVDNGADPDTAEVLQDLMRHIEIQSDAQAAYAQAGDSQATIGRGWIRVVTEFEDERSFNLSLKIKRVRNPFSVYMDPAASEPDASDARYCFVVEDIPKDEFIDRFGQSAWSSLLNFMQGPDKAPNWLPEGRARVAEYWYVDHVPDTLVILRPVDPMQLSYLEQAHPEFLEPMLLSDLPTEEVADETTDGTEVERRPVLPPGMMVVNQRPVLRPQTKVALISGSEILEGNEDKTEGEPWPGTRIPIVPVIGDEIDIDGEIDYRGMVRDAKGPQVLYNYQNTALAEALMGTTKTPWIGFEGQFAGHEKKWSQANRRVFPYLEVRPVTVNGQLAPLPQRNSPTTDVGAIVAAIRQADYDLKSTTGLFEPSLGERQGQQSGKAIMALQRQGDLATSGFFDNLGRAIRAIGKILLTAIPQVYDSARVLRLVGPDEKPYQAMIFAGEGMAPPVPTDPEARKLFLKKQQIKGIYDLGVGRYDVTINVGPSHESKREAAAQALLQFVQAFPAAFPMLGDLIMSSLDWPGAREAAKRLRKMLPPQVQDGDEQGDGDGKPQIPPQVQQQMQQLMQQHEMLVQELQAANEKLTQNEAEAEARERMKLAEIQSRERIAALNAHVSLAETHAKIAGEQGLAKLKAEMDRLSKLIEIAHDDVITGKQAAADKESRLIEGFLAEYQKRIEAATAGDGTVTTGDAAIEDADMPVAPAASGGVDPSALATLATEGRLPGDGDSGTVESDMR